MDYYDRAGLTPYLDKLGFNLVGYGCTTCIGNSGPLIPAVSAAVADGDLAVCSVLSGNRNFEGRIHPETKLNYLASPPLVVAYALAGIDGHRPDRRPAGHRQRRAAGLPARHLAVGGRDRRGHRRLPAPGDVHPRVRARCSPATSGGGPCRPRPGTSFAWDPASTYVRRPPYFDGWAASPAPLRRHRGRPGARPARRLGHHRPHLPGRRDQGRLPGRALPDPSTGCSRGTSTPTGRGAATTR